MDNINEELQTYINDNSISIYAVSNNEIFPLGSASCSAIKDEWYFNRLFVHPKYRNKKYGTKLLTELLKIVKEKNTVLHMDINPYGEMSYQQLEAFYLKHGFIKYNKGNYFTYYFNKNEKKTRM